MVMVSRQPRKQRKAVYTAALHTRRKFVSAHLAKELRTKLGTKRRSIAVRKGDRVKVLRGGFKGRSGKVTDVDLKKSWIFVEGCVRRKSGGRETMAPIRPSNVMIVEADFGDKCRKAVLERK